MDISQLTTLVAVAELGTVKKASERLSIVQPALSRQINLLERELGVRLFDRHGRGMVLTEVGAKVVARATRVLQEIGQIRSEMERESGMVSGDVVLGLSPNVAEFLTVPLARRLNDEQPGIKLRIFIAYAGSVQEALQASRIDLAVLSSQGPVNTINTSPILTEPVFLIASPEMISSTTPVSFSELSKWPLILTSEHNHLRQVIEATAAERGISLNRRFEVNDVNAVRDLVVAGLGVALLQASACRLHPTQMLAVPLYDPVIPLKVVMATSVIRPLTKAGKIVAGLAREEIHRLVGSGVWQGAFLTEPSA